MTAIHPLLPTQKASPMFGDENTIISGSGNVFADLGLPDADEHLLKARLASLIGETIVELGLNQRLAAKLLGLTQPDISNLKRGRLGGFSIERLFGLVRTLGNDIEIRVRPPRAQSDRPLQGRVRMMVG